MISCVRCNQLPCVYLRIYVLSINAKSTVRWYLHANEKPPGQWLCSEKRTVFCTNARCITFQVVSAHSLSDKEFGKDVSAAEV
jgi:hypothetical protein